MEAISAYLLGFRGLASNSVEINHNGLYKKYHT